MIRLAVRVARADAADARAELLVFSPAGVEELDGDGDAIEYVLYGFGGNPGESFKLGDAVIAFALPSATAAAAAKAKAK